MGTDPAGGGPGTSRGREDGNRYVVPAPTPPDDPAAWYAPTVLEQRAVHPGVVVTVRRVPDEEGEQFRYDVREPGLTGGGERALERVCEYFADANTDRPLTREGCRERMQAGFSGKYERAIDRLVDRGPTARRRLEYHVLAAIRGLGRVTPHALDGRITAAETRDGRVIVHTETFAPVRTDITDPDPRAIERFTAERLARYTVDFLDFEVPVVRYRENAVGDDPFTVKYAVREPDLLPGDRELIAECKERVWETSVDGVPGTGAAETGAGGPRTERGAAGTESESESGSGAGGEGESGSRSGSEYADRAAFVRERAERVLKRRLSARTTRAWLDAVRHRLREALAAYGLGVPPVDDRYARDRLADLTYYVLRDYVGYGQLTIPIRDPHLEDIEANRVGERVKVVPRGSDRRVPTNLRFADETAFVNVVTQLAAADGVELNGATPSAKVNLSPAGIDETIRCAVALPVVSEDGPHISIRKQAADPLTPVDLVANDSLPTDLVALLWLVYEHHGTVLFAGPTGAGKTTLMNAHVPFIGFDDRPVSIDEGSREVRLPHETGVSLTTRDHESAHKRVTMSDLMTETNYLNPDVEVIAEINTPESFATFGEAMQTGHGLIGTTHAEDVETLVNRVIEQGLPSYLLSEIDLVVFPRHVGDDRYVGEAIEIIDRTRAGPDTDRVERDATTVHYDHVCRRTPDGEWTAVSDPERAAGAETETMGAGASASTSTDADANAEVTARAGASGRPHLFERLAEREDRRVDAVAAEFERKHRYVQYLVREGIDDYDALFAFLADLRADESATIERIIEAEPDRKRERSDGESDDPAVAADGGD